jgi:hypothetical protein
MTILFHWHSCMKYVQCGPQGADGFKLPTLGRWQQWEKPVGGFRGCVCMTALNVMQDVQYGNVCLLSSTSCEAIWSWMCTKHFGGNFITTVGTVARLIQSVVRWNRVIWNCYQEKEELQTGEHGTCESCARAKSKLFCLRCGDLTPHMSWETWPELCTQTPLFHSQKEEIVRQLNTHDKQFWLWYCWDFTNVPQQNPLLPPTRMHALNVGEDKQKFWYWSWTNPADTLA